MQGRVGPGSLLSGAGAGEDCGGSQCDPCAGTFKTAGQNGRKNFGGQVKSTLLSILFYGKILSMNENEEDDNGERSSF